MLLVDEIFTSIQGESTDMGKPCIFVRLHGCPINCSYCDTLQGTATKRYVEDIVNTCVKQEVREVCITGGEPLIQKETMSLVYALSDRGKRVSIETSGCVPIEEEFESEYASERDRHYRYIMDIKCPSSGVVHKNIYENIRKLNWNDDLVFVIKDREDYEFMKEVLKNYPTHATVMLSPMFSGKKIMIGKDLVDWVLEDRLNVRLQVQMHKVLNVQ